jgi:hypothetical protein
MFSNVSKGQDARNRTNTHMHKYAHTDKRVNENVDTCAHVRLLHTCVQNVHGDTKG